MWTGEYESNKVLADAYYIHEKGEKISVIKNTLIPVDGALYISRRRCAWNRLQRTFKKKKRDVPVVFLNKPITFERSRRRSFVTSLFYWLASMERLFYFKFRPIHVQYA